MDNLCSDDVVKFQNFPLETWYTWGKTPEKTPLPSYGRIVRNFFTNCLQDEFFMRRDPCAREFFSRRFV